MQHRNEHISLVWLRRDLRLYDHAALAAACRTSGRVALCFVFDTVILRKLEDRNDRRVTFIHESLREIDETLRKRGSMLVVRHGDPAVEIPALAQSLNATSVFAGMDFEPYAVSRDERIRKELDAIGVRFSLLLDQVIVHPDSILTGNGSPYKVYTPYLRSWKSFIAESPGSFADAGTLNLRSLAAAAELESHSHLWSLGALEFVKTGILVTPGERAGRKQLLNFMGRIDRYDRDRDIPSVDGTSGLSTHLRFGTVSIRECFRLAFAHDSPGAEKWMQELVWREFYNMILHHFPYVERHAFRREYDGLVWEGKEEHFHAWSRGMTGYPIVDAAMRLFNATGWMHNRLRMVAAMFLTKDLLIDWRIGEAYFARYLVDFDLASNNGGWQWSASTGVDAQPYFRVFNPVLQSQRFDPDGVFIRAHVPELRGFDNRSIHFPVTATPIEQAAAGCIIGKDYPAPIVDHAVQKEKAIRMFKR